MVAVNTCLHRLIEAQGRLAPDSPAVVFENVKLTYAELDRRANRLAAHLASLGVGPDATVGLFVERSAEMIVGILAILKAGGAYVPIDPAYPAERVAYMLSDSGAVAVLTHASLAGRLPAKGPQAVQVDTFDWHGTEKTEPFAADVQPHHLAYVIYTSGSTGQPKGVCIEHRNIVNYVHGVIERLRLEPGMSYATVSTIAADLGNTVIFPALATGGCLHVISQPRAENGGLLAEYFRRENIDVLKIVPSHFAALNPEGVMPRKRLILGGEASRLDWVERLRAAAPGCEIFNHYGPTETTVGVLTFHAGAQPIEGATTLPLGKPLPGIEVKLVDDEICIGGAGVARGYLNRPALTAEKFAGGFYRTGDRGRLLPDGSIEFRGRVDHQVKLHGYRVELGEIEAALRSHGAVRDAVVLLREDHLVAYVAPAHADQQALREHLKTRLPPYMVPSVFVRLEKLPLTANGKIDRQGLAGIALEKNETPVGAASAPRTETEQALAAIWAELLQVPEVGIHDDVFDLGAHSLMAMKALTQIRERFNVSLSLRNLFEHPSVAALAEAVETLLLARPGNHVHGEREEFVL
jgi:amino acid adenylation domain-containing protein